MSRVSVIIPAFDSAQFIGETLASVFAQTFSDFEVIVVNDGSHDEAQLEEVLQPYRDRIVYVAQENRGPSAARNAGIKRACGEFVAFLDSDDCWLPGFLAEQLRAFEDDPQLDLIYADASLEDGTRANSKSFMNIFPSRGPVTLEALLDQRCVVITSCVVARRQALIDVGLFDERYFRSEDFDLWVRMAYAGKRLGYQRNVLARHRVHNGSLAADLTRMHRSASNVYRKLARKLELTAAQCQTIEKQISNYEAALALADGKFALAAGNHEQAAKFFARARELQPKLGWRDWKLRLVLSCLNVAPRTFGRVYQRRDRRAAS